MKSKVLPFSFPLFSTQPNEVIIVFVLLKILRLVAEEM
jgi:hypothetical protein